MAFLNLFFVLIVIGKMMWCATLQRCLDLRMEEHAPILNTSEVGRQVYRKYKSLLHSIVQLGTNLLRSWNLLSVRSVSCFFLK